MKEIFINVDSYNNEGIKTIQGNNNAETYKICILKSKVRLSLVGKTVKLGYVMAGTTKGDIIEDLNISNAEQGEITFPITNKISKKDGVYTCQLAIYGADGFLEYTATFGLTVQANIFTKIAGEIENSKDLTYIERILEKATNISEELKSNIPVARQLNIDLENQNRILNENMDRANGVNNTLITTTEQSKVAATSAIEKKSQLESSITKAKEFIDGLDGSQNIPQLRLDVTELQNGLKSNQALAYAGSSINAENTLEGRTEGMRIGGRTLLNLVSNTPAKNASNVQIEKLLKSEMFKVGTTYTVNIPNRNNKPIIIVVKTKDGVTKNINLRGSENTFTVEGEYPIVYRLTLHNLNGWDVNNDLTNADKSVIVEGNNIIIDNYFEDIKSFGEAEQEGDKYKISILSRNKNLFKSYEELISVKKGEQLYLSSKLTDGCTRIDIQIDNKTDITVSDIMYWRGTEKLYRLASDRNKLDVSFTVNRDCNIKLTNKYLKAKEYKDIQLEKGTQATQYQLYKVDKKDILISAPLPGFDFGEDIMYEDNGQVKITRNIDKYIFTGAETMRDTTEQDEKSGTGKYKVFALTVNKTIDINKNINNNFPKNQFNVAFQNMDSEGLAVTQYGVYIKILKSKLSTQDAEGLKTWLRTNQTVIYFSKATPTTEIVENCIDIDLDTYQEKTYFNILNLLPGTLDFKVPSNIGSLVQSNAKEINNINEFINNFILKALLEMNKDLAAIKIKNGLN